MKQASFELSPAFVTRALELPSIPPDSPTAPFSQVTTDSRKITSGCLFVAIPGDKFDGHDFIAAAIEKGAKGIIARASYEFTPPDTVHYFTVEDTVTAYRQLAGAWRRKFSVPVVVIAGAVGKTTTKEILTAILRGRWPKVLKTQGSQNGFVGIPMTLLELRPDHGAAVIEVGIDEIGAMEQHIQLVEPSASIVTAVAPEHLEKLIDLPTVAREEGIAISAVAEKGGSVAINLDDSWIRPHFDQVQAAKIGYTVVERFAPKTPEVLQGRISPDRKTLEVLGCGFENENFPLPLPGAHNARNLLAALAVARNLGLTPHEMRRGLETFQGAEGRSELRELQLPGGTIPVVCDYYNASPASMEAGLKLLTEVAQDKRQRWVCLGDMLELGPNEENFHRELANPIEALGIENVLLYGPRMKALKAELSKRHYKGTLQHFESREALYLFLAPRLQPDHCVLIKGSRGMKMEEVWKRLSAK